MIDIAFSRADERLPAQDDIVRSFDECVVVVANAYDSGFSTHWSAGSRAALDLFAERWHATHDLKASFAHVRLKFPALAETLVGDVDNDPFDEPAATLLAAAVERTHVDVVWIGPQHLVVVRDHVVVARTQPDTLVEMGRTQGFDITDSPHRQVITRTISRRDIMEPHTSRFALEKGDRVIIAYEAVDGAISGETPREVLEMMPRSKVECVIFAT